MTRTRLLGAATTLTALALVTAPAMAQTKFEFWYGLSGDLSERIQDMCKTFNESQSDYEIVCVSQDNYDNNLQNTIAAFRANKQPTVTQIFDAGTLDLMLSEAYVPVRQLMEENGYDIDWSNYFAGVGSYYSTSTGELLSMPFNSSTAVIYYNTDALAKVGFEGTPSTWTEVEDVARKMKAAGYDCPVAFDPAGAWQWFEQFSAIHDQPIATLGNGFGGLNAEMAVSKGKFVDQLTWIKAMYDEGLFVLKSKDTGETANDAFVNGKCQITSSSIADHGTFGKQAAEGVHWTVAMLPMLEGFERHNSFVGGASLWTLKGKSAEEYKGAAAFYNFLATPEQTQWWSTVTGYIPVTNSGFEAMKAAGFYDAAPYKGRELAIESLTMPAGENTRGIRLGGYASIRAEMVKTIQSVLFNNTPVPEALADFDAKGNEMLRRFEQTYAGKTLP
ncbi:extracellular solute-binding protein [Devosia sp. 63-57]|uniref:extracellular solute-binding protein n=1 Tax=Devosia sp. 63-57 TaxID=1895751 RepID=UPI00086B6F2A|nr:extracellular solute-binding protein [Devosia sp. 63-57]ODT48858.1 MAG: glycerol 3-phosphate ABC transporter [Pelagibacterium sp. SCN 63-126]ODU86854.1 MAG: glycerol 3-phosphate ABC transporter [Pelagibacterium sp. SCN 63-17]OJX44214.1 MAG: glycerol 3-phosphate ABC transporter [Devosia sp. 63-57]